ncbi:hypothetical protein DERP_010098 [Dermatophagoides pteronyssinus]|uniref:Uncharacterized protein n=1 Tax=Dermatophagoides pteronyssinus TaxID=6956 RepID=A0ABQ8JFF1_DERPT|nr:hypothetical protein DERP_010098 [Dermatophagoides pteronyssinus]
MIFKPVLIFLIPLFVIISTNEFNYCPTSDFDASVAINECYALLFNTKYMWLLDICNFHLTAVYNFEFELIKCLHDGHIFPVNNSQQQQKHQYEQQQQQQRPQLFAWNRFRKMKSLIMSYNNYPNSNYICIELNNKICYFPIIITEQYPNNDYLNTIGNINSIEDEIYRNSCQSDVIVDVDDDFDGSGQTPTIIEMAHMYYHVSSPKGSKIYRLHGRNFYADIIWTPSSYDLNRLIFSIKLFKLMTDHHQHQYQHNNRPEMIVDDLSIDNRQNEEPSSSSNTDRPDYEPEYILLENVSTFLIMPTDIEVMIFFTTNEFCIINYFTKNCGRRSTRDLFGCDDDDTGDDAYTDNNIGIKSNRPHNITVVNIETNDRSFNEPSNNDNTDNTESSNNIVVESTTTATTLPKIEKSISIKVKNISTTKPIIISNNNDNGSSSKFISTTTTTMMPFFTKDPSIMNDNFTRIIVESHEKRNKQQKDEQIINTTTLSSSSLLCHTNTTIVNSENVSKKTTENSNRNNMETVTINYVDTAAITNSNNITNHTFSKKKKPNDSDDYDEKYFAKEITCDIDCVILKRNEFKIYEKQNKRGTLSNDNDDDDYTYPSYDYNLKNILAIIFRTNIIHGHFLKNGLSIIGRIIFRAIKFCTIISLIICSIMILIIFIIHHLGLKNFRADIFLYIMLSFFTQKLKQT